MHNSSYTIEIEKELYTLLQRSSLIEGRTISDIADSLLRPYLKKYRHNSLEEWESVQEMEEIEKVVASFQKNEGFDPNHIPFDTQIIGLRRKLDELDREIANNKSPDLKLKELRFSLIEELNFAEAETLKKQRHKRVEQSELWKTTCDRIPLD